MNNLVTLFLIFLVQINLVFAQNYFKGLVLEGNETFNQQYTGKRCQVEVNSVAQSTKGVNCYKLDFNFLSPLIGKKMNLLVESIVAHKQNNSPFLKSCATSLNGNLDENSIFEQNEPSVYTRFFTGMKINGNKQFDYFFKVSPISKLPQEAAVHVLSWFQDDLIECLDLKLK